MIRTMSILCLLLAACVVGTDDGDTTDGKADGTGGGNGNGGGSGGGDGDGDGGALTAAEFVTELGKRECDDAFACKATFPTDAGVTFEEAFGADAPACYALVATYYDAAAVDAAIAAGNIMFDGAAAKACVDGMSAPTCATYWNEGPALPDACATALVGTVATGGACTTDFECAGENWCDETSKCAPVPAGA